MFKSQLQEYAQKAALPPPVYAFVKEGPPHDPRFRATVIVNGVTYQGGAGFTNLKKAEHDAAKVALEALLRKSDSPGVSPAPVHQSGLCKNLLQEYAQKSGLALPVYRSVRAGEDHSPRFTATVEIEGVQYSGGIAKTRKEAEIRAARVALLAIQTQPPSSLASPAHEQALPALPALTFANSLHGRQGQPPKTSVHSRQGQQHGVVVHLTSGRQGHPMVGGGGQGQQSSMALVHLNNGRQGQQHMALLQSGNGRQGQPPMTLLHSGNGRQVQAPITPVHSGYGGQGQPPMTAVHSGDGRLGQVPINLVHSGDGRQLHPALTLLPSGSGRLGQPRYGGMPMTQPGMGRQGRPGYGVMTWSHAGDVRQEQPGYSGMDLPYSGHGRHLQLGQGTASFTDSGDWRQANERKRARQDHGALETYRGGKKVLHLPPELPLAEPYDPSEACYEPSSQESCLSQQLEQSSAWQGGGNFDKAEAMKRLVTEAWRIAEEVVTHQQTTT